MKLVSWLLKLLWFFLKIIFGILILWAAFQYLCAPVYDFPQKKKFAGDKIYNPYGKCDSLAWKKAVFHIHSISWGGVTNGASSEQQIFDRYKYLGYDIVALSDYQKINTAKYPLQQELIANYEHGFGMKKNHHINIGAKSVLPFDFMFPQTLSNKQFIINLLRSRTELLALAHPDWNSAVLPADVKQLCNYDFIEALNNNHNSINLWDTALSAGAPVFLISDDDGHDINNPNVVGRCLTLVNTLLTNKESVISALKAGKSIGVAVASKENESFEAKKAIISKLPVLRYLKLSGDTIQIAVSDTSAKIQFIGQNGLVVGSKQKTLQAAYLFKKNDTYIRTVITFQNGTVYYLNPFIRFNGLAFTEYHPSVNMLWTGLKNGLFLIIIIAFGSAYIRRRRRK